MSVRVLRWAIVIVLAVAYAFLDLDAALCVLLAIVWIPVVIRTVRAFRAGLSEPAP